MPVSFVVTAKLICVFVFAYATRSNKKQGHSLLNVLVLLHLVGILFHIKYFGFSLGVHVSVIKVQMYEHEYVLQLTSLNSSDN